MILTGEDIIYLSCGYWDSPLITHQQIAMRLSSKNRVLYVEPSIAYFSLKYTERWKKWIDWTRKTKHLKDSLYLSTCPPSFPFKGSSQFLNHIGQAWPVRSIKKRIQELEFKNPILWLFSPLFIEMIGNFKEKLIIYHCIDEFTAAPWYRPGVIKNMEKHLLKKADLVITCSKSVYDRKRMFCQNIVNVPNGVDFEFYHQALSDEIPIPEDISSIRRPIIGFSGVMDFRFDIKLLFDAAKALEDISFVLIGPDKVGLKQLNSLKNVYHLGMKPVQSLPNYLKAFDVCMIPYKLNEFVMNISPVKLHEYLATGKPIVSTAIPAALEYGEVLYISNTTEDFVKHLKLAVNENDNYLVEKRIKLAMQNTWEDRIKNISERVQALLLVSRRI